MGPGDRQRVARATRQLAQAQAWLFGALAVCVVVLPEFLFSRDMGGVSNFAVNRETVLPYSVGVLVAASLQWRAAGQLATVPEARRLRAVTRLASVGLVLTLLTSYPYQLDERWAALHTRSAVALALVELAGGLLLVSTHLSGRDRATALVPLLAGSTGLALNGAGLLPVLFAAEAVTAAGFAVALVASSAALARGEPSRDGQPLDLGTRPAVPGRPTDVP